MAEHGKTRATPSITNTNDPSFIEGENIRLIAGETVEINDDDDHFLHFQDHGPILFDRVKFSNMQPKARKALIRHIRDHLNLIDPQAPTTTPETIVEAGAPVPFDGLP